MRTPYLSDDRIDGIFKYAEIDVDAEDRFYEVVDDSIAQMETELSERYVIPLKNNSGSYANSKEHSKQMVSRLLAYLIEKNVGVEFMKNSEESDGQAYVNQKSKRAKEIFSKLLDPKYDFGFKLAPHASDFNPVQVIGIARGDNKFRTEPM